MNIKCACDELLDVSKIQPNPKNPNKHSDEQIKRLAKIIEYQGQRSPIVISKRSGFVVVGHGRLEAMKLLGWEKVGVNYQEFDSEAQEYAHMTADNAIAEWASLDLKQINEDFLDFGPDFDVDMMGLKEFEIEPLEGSFPDLAGSDPDCQQVTFILSNEQRDILNEALKKAKKEEDCEDEINENKNGNALGAILRRYVYG